MEHEAPAQSTANPASSLYQPLRVESKEIRVIHLHPGKWTDRISCSLATISLDELPSDPATTYEALSYVWVAEPGYTQIVLNNEPYEVTTNLFFALRRLRKGSEDRVMWVDALCINQRDDVEKGTQVAMMGTIYRLCIRVYLWLGEPRNPDGSFTNDWSMEECSSFPHSSTEMHQDVAFQVFQLIREFAQDIHWPEISFFRPCEVDEEISCLGMIMSCVTGRSSTFIKSNYQPGGLDRKVLDALGSMISSEWFTRLWVVQEVLLPREAIFLWGSFALPWNTFSEAAESIYNHGNNCCREFWTEMQSNHCAYLNSLIIKANGLRLPLDLGSSPGSKFDKLLWAFCPKIATQPVDKIYGLLGLPCTSEFTITPDYAISKEQLYTEVAILCLREEGYLDVLKGQKKRSSGLPSWVHDWSLPIDEEEWDMERTIIRLTCYTASLGFRSVIHTNGTTRLTLSGVYISSVSFTTESSDRRPESRGIVLKLVLDWYRICQSPSWRDVLCERYKMPPRTWKSAFRATITGDLRPSFYAKLSRRASSNEADQDAEAFESWLSAAETQNWGLLNGGSRPAQLQHLIEYMSFYRSFFITNTGYMGMGRVQEGDEIWVLLGGDVPFILRPVPGSSEYTLVGDCYLHGIMDGEAVADIEGKLRSVVLV